MKRGIQGLALASAIFAAACDDVRPLPTQTEAAREPQAAAAPAAKQSDGGIRRDAAEYANANGVSVAEAIRRIELQAAIGDLNGKLEEQEATFAGLYIEHEPEYRVVARFTRDGAATLQRYVAGTALAGVVRAEAARASLADLRKAQQTALQAVRARGIEADGNVDVRANVAEVRVLNAAAARAAEALDALRLPAQARVVVVEALSRPSAPIYGGAFIKNLNTGSYCTGGFTVRHSSGARGILTAGHCDNNMWVWDYVDQAYYKIWFQAERFYGAQDVQWHTTPYTPDNWVWTGSNYREILATRSRANQNVGDWACKYGVSSGYSCGYIQTKTFTPGYVPGATSTYIVVHRDGVDNCTPGDSGGPWFVSNTALGVMSGHINNVDGIYMAINFASYLDITPLTN
ncbi:MAG TPA: S1 family peptidase [Longimicrobiaceae bacterium]|nr:S1 family peptidase [Longimicrobiaceae bacterium]